MPDLSGLNKFAHPYPQSVSEDIKPVQPLNGRFNGDALILAFDQAIAKTGWALLTPRGKVERMGVITTEPTHKGHEDTLVRAEALRIEVDDLIWRWRPSLIVHEIPPVGGKMMRPESSLVAATVIRVVAGIAQGRVVMYGAQAVKKRFVGKTNATKGELKKAILALDPRLEEFNRKGLNEHTVDAIGLGWLSLESEHG